MVKVVVFNRSCEGPSDSYYTGPGGLAENYGRLSQVENLSFAGFGGRLVGENLDAFLRECEDADVVVLDSKPFDSASDPELSDFFGRLPSPEVVGDPYKGRRDIDVANLALARRISFINPTAYMFVIAPDSVGSLPTDIAVSRVHSDLHDLVIDTIGLAALTDIAR